MPLTNTRNSSHITTVCHTQWIVCQNTISEQRWPLKPKTHSLAFSIFEWHTMTMMWSVTCSACCTAMSYNVNSLACCCWQHSTTKHVTRNKYWLSARNHNFNERSQTFIPMHYFVQEIHNEMIPSCRSLVRHCPLSSDQSYDQTWTDAPRSSRRRRRHQPRRRLSNSPRQHPPLTTIYCPQCQPQTTHRHIQTYTDRHRHTQSVSDKPPSQCEQWQAIYTKKAKNLIDDC